MTITSETINVTVPEGQVPARLDKTIALLYPDLSRTRIKNLIEEGRVIVAGNIVSTPSFKVQEHDVITIEIPPAVDDTPEAQNISLDIIYEDDDLLVINKAADMVVHPGAGNHDGTLVNALLYHCKGNLSGIGGVKRPGIVHRLDRETSGLMVVAKNDKAHQGLSDQLQDRTLSRTYEAIVWRVPTLIKGKINEPVGRHQTNRLKMAVMKSSGRDAVTHYHVQENYGEVACLVECKLESGRTHQIRVHMQHIKHPIVGDPLYGLPQQEGEALLKKASVAPENIQKIMDFGRQALHAREIGFIHPLKGEPMHFKQKCPEDLLILKKCFKSIS
jgi:23S rRNA pseudouridine1911/1915/1917 synthase